MSSINKTSKQNSPVKGCVAYHLSGILSTNLKQGFSITYLYPLLIISSEIKEVLIEVWSEAKKIHALSLRVDNMSGSYL